MLVHGSLRKSLGKSFARFCSLAHNLGCHLSLCPGSCSVSRSSRSVKSSSLLLLFGPLFGSRIPRGGCQGPPQIGTPRSSISSWTFAMSPMVVSLSSRSALIMRLTTEFSSLL